MVADDAHTLNGNLLCKRVCYLHAMRHLSVRTERIANFLSRLMVFMLREKRDNVISHNVENTQAHPALLE